MQEPTNHYQVQLARGWCSVMVSLLHNHRMADAARRTYSKLTLYKRHQFILTLTSAQRMRYRHIRL